MSISASKNIKNNPKKNETFRAREKISTPKVYVSMDFVTFTWLCYAVIIFSLIVFIFYITVEGAPSFYGKLSQNADFTINPKLGWFLMEVPSLIICSYCYFTGV